MSVVRAGGTTIAVPSSQGGECRELEEKNDIMNEHLTLSRKLQKAVLQLRDDATAKAQREFEKQRATIEAELHSERIQNSTLAACGCGAVVSGV
ncbi:hypothetical protein AXG93_598s1060 [Marchantia polymorpha subsp. ruderalis]|uniref:Uncharacterized protein n=1 Tax=Marchantia polymorpha subsp. ruderalis TaxID=1480154 RepID=A0A176VV61_MARPO|nr:hypothetical protein AXG93_598s1060 [Marchantia polymorpha subsp. ruderalis]